MRPAHRHALLAFTAASAWGGASVTQVLGGNRHTSPRDGMIAAMRKATSDSPRGKFTLSASHNPVQKMFLREALGRSNEHKGVTVKDLADPGRGCKT